MLKKFKQEKFTFFAGLLVSGAQLEFLPPANFFGKDPKKIEKNNNIKFMRRLYLVVQGGLMVNINQNLISTLILFYILFYPLFFTQT